MEKTIIVHSGDKETEIPVKASMAALRIYRAEFNADLIQDLTAVYEASHYDPYLEAVKKSNLNPNGLTRDELIAAVMENIDYSSIDANGDALPVVLDGVTRLKAYQCIWAMAKAANKQTERFDDWCDLLDVMPIGDVVEQCMQMWNLASAGTIELKN